MLPVAPSTALDARAFLILESKMSQLSQLIKTATALE